MTGTDDASPSPFPSPTWPGPGAGHASRPEHPRALLSAFFDEIGQRIEAFGGTVETYAGEDCMTYDVAKLDEIVLALLHLNAFGDRGVVRTWKSFDWDSLNRLHARALISDPRSKAKSVVLTEEGARLAEELFRRHFGGGGEGRA